MRTGLLGVAVLLIAVGPLQADTAPSPTKRELKVAFIADTGSGIYFRSVLQLIKQQQADMVLHQGDLGYGKSTAFLRAIDDVLGPDFPYFASRGNHEGGWELWYQRALQQRAERAGAICHGNYGQNAACTFQGLFFVLSAGGESGPASRNARYLEQQLSADNSIWRICSWHRNRKWMQIGHKPNEVGWDLYEACRKGGAIIATGHGHYYARTRTLSNTRELSINSRCDTPAGDQLCVARANNATGEPGSTFVFISGLGGRDYHTQQRCLPVTFPYGQGRHCNGIWARIYSKKQGARYGALFITFNIEGDPYRARGEFVTVVGETIDAFTITAGSRTN